jgi:hypothetical protein
MATEAQVHANRQNAQHSTGPVTAEGKSTSSRNALTLGLYTRQDYVKPEERDIYKEFCETMYSELAPVTLLEQSLAAEITGASWRLRRCSAAEAELSSQREMARPYPHETTGAENSPSSADYATQDPLLDDSTDKTRRSIERARASAHSLLHRSINQLRRLQTDRITAATFFDPNPVPASMGISESARISAVLVAKQRAQAPKANPNFMAELEALCQPPADMLADLDAYLAERQSASNCKDEIAPESAAPQSTGRTEKTPRNAPCPCKSGQKFKRCCGRNPAMLMNRAA